MNEKNRENGLISVYTLGVMLLFLFIAIGIYNITSKKYKKQSEMIEETIKIYNENTI